MLVFGDLLNMTVLLHFDDAVESAGADVRALLLDLEGGPAHGADNATRLDLKARSALAKLFHLGKNVPDQQFYPALESVVLIGRQVGDLYLGVRG